jgi:hypothetical protein
MHRDGRHHREQHAVGRHPQARLPESLHRHRHKAREAADAEPHGRRVVRAQATSGKPGIGEDHEDGRHREKDAALSEHLQVLVVSLVRERAPIGGLVQEHRSLERTEARTRQRV